MTHYQKLATLAFRIIGLAGILYSVFLVPYSYFLIGQGTLVFTFPFYFLLGLISFALAKPFGKLVCFGLND